jgi:hypothetical protein
MLHYFPLFTVFYVGGAASFNVTHCIVILVVVSSLFVQRSSRKLGYCNETFDIFSMFYINNDMLKFMS